MPPAPVVNPSKMFDLPGGRVSWTSLHNTVYESTGPLDVIALMVSKNRTSKAQSNLLQMATANGELPLHLAVSTRRDTEVMKYLIQEYPESIHHPNKYLALPIHFAAYHQRNPEVVRILLEKGGLKGDGLGRVCSGGNLPLHLAALASTSPEVVELLCRKVSDGGKEGRREDREERVCFPILPTN
jgi:ankyrin repeat protein